MQLHEPKKKKESNSPQFLASSQPSSTWNKELIIASSILTVNFVLQWSTRMKDTECTHKLLKFNYPIFLLIKKIKYLQSHLINTLIKMMENRVFETSLPKQNHNCSVRNELIWNYLVIRDQEQHSVPIHQI